MCSDHTTVHETPRAEKLDLFVLKHIRKLEKL